MSDDEVKAAYDKAMQHTSVGANFWLSELDRRAYERAAEASQRLAEASLNEARAARKLTKINTWLAAAAVLAAIASIWAAFT